MGDTKVKISSEDEEDPWDEIEDEEDVETAEKEIDNQVEEEFLD